MESQLRDISGLLQIIRYTSDDSGFLASVGELLQAYRPLLVLQADIDGAILAAESLNASLDPGIAAPLGRQMAEGLRGQTACRFEVPHDGELRTALALRMHADPRGALLGCLLESPLATEGLEHELAIARAVCGAFTWAMMHHKADAARFQTRIRHLHSEAETLKIAHNEAVARVMAEHEERVCIEQEHLALEEFLQAAEAANRAKNEFLTNMSHELRTPMTAILGFADVLEENLKDSESLAAIQTIRRNGEHLLEIITDILDLSMIESGRLALERTAVSPIQLITDVISRLQVRAEGKGLPLSVSYEPPIPEAIFTDPIRLRQILINLLGNAIKFTETGSVRIALRLLQHPDERSLLAIDVIDTGIGIPAEQRAKLFQPFSLGDASLKRKYNGTGLGVALSKRLAALLGGDLTVESEPGRGSTFQVTVSTGPLEGVRLLDSPVASSTPSHGSSPTAKAAPIRLNCRILLAEDGPDNQRLVGHVLKKAGAEVVLANHGGEALEKTLATLRRPAQLPPAEPAFDLVLMDIQMPVMDGYEATRQLRLAGYTGPIIALSAQNLAHDIKECFAAGCNDYLAKPIDRQRLLATVARYTAKAAELSQRDCR